MRRRRSTGSRGLREHVTNRSLLHSYWPIAIRLTALPAQSDTLYSVITTDSHGEDPLVVEALCIGRQRYTLVERTHWSNGTTRLSTRAAGLIAPR